jgi:dolichol-phosphate mannosyltransferase
MKTVIIMPTYNEAENLSPLLQAIFSYAPLTDVLIVDDHSPDGTGELADSLHKTDVRVHVLHRAGKLGLAVCRRERFSPKFSPLAGRFRPKSER